MGTQGKGKVEPSFNGYVSYLNRVRMDLGLTELEMYKKLGMSKQLWQHKKRARNQKVPDAKKLALYAKKLGVSTERLEAILKAWMFGQWG